MPPVKSKLTLAYSLSVLLAMLLLASSVVGLVCGGSGLYDSYPASLAGLVGQDALTLVFGIPLLIVSAWLSARGSVRRLLWFSGGSLDLLPFAPGSMGTVIAAALTAAATSGGRGGYGLSKTLGKRGAGRPWS